MYNPRFQDAPQFEIPWQTASSIRSGFSTIGIFTGYGKPAYTAVTVTVLSDASNPRSTCCGLQGSDSFSATQPAQRTMLPH